MYILVHYNAKHYIGVHNEYQRPVERVTDGADLTVDEARARPRGGSSSRRQLRRRSAPCSPRSRAKGRPRRRSRVRTGDARRRPDDRARPGAARRHLRDRRRRLRHNQRLDDRRDRRGGRGRPDRQARQLLGVPPRREAPTCWRSRAPTWRPSRRRSRKRSRPTGSGSCSRPSSTRR